MKTLHILSKWINYVIEVVDILEVPIVQQIVQ